MKNMDDLTTNDVVRYARNILLTVVTIVFISSGFYTVDAGYRTVVVRFGEAVRVSDPGLHFKLPMIESTRHFDVREQRYNVTLAAATTEQLAVKAEVSFIGAIDPTKVTYIYRTYGSPEGFIKRIIIPRVIQSAKETFGSSTAQQLIQERAKAAADMTKRLNKALASRDRAVLISDAIIVNVKLPQKYLAEIEAKKVAQQAAIREQSVLEQNALQQQQKVNAAKAEAEAVVVNAKAEADAIVLRANAQAKAYAKIGAQLARFPQVIQQLQISKWNGAVPRVNAGGEGNVGLLIQPGQ